ncbi:MAG: hypothetical protein ACI4PH_10365 [Faecousia sp.]
MKLFAGAGCGTIHFPDALFPIEGFCGVHDAPAARVLVIECGKKAALVSLELVMLPPEFVDRVKAIVAGHTGAKKENIWVHTTHAITTPHAPHAPIGMGGVPLEVSPADRKNLDQKIRLYSDAVMTAVTEAAEAAAKSCRPASLGIGRCESHISVNRDIETPFGWWIGLNPGGKTDPMVSLLRLDDETGNCIGVVMACGLKPCAIDNSQMAEGRRLVSSDVPGLACRLIEAELNAPCFFFMGAAGDQVPREQALLEEVLEDGSVKTTDLGVEAGLAMVERLGRELAQDILPEVKGISCNMETPSIAVGMTYITWGGKERRSMQPRKIADFVRERDVTIDGRIMTIGDVALVGLKPEINCITGEQLRKASPYPHTIAVAMIDGGQKYMPDAESYRKITWESQSSMMMPGAAEAWVEAVVATLTEMKGAQQDE